MKIAIYSDPLMGKGGGSRVVVELANRLNADIITSGFDKKLLAKLNKNVKVIDIGNRTVKKIFSFGYLFEAPVRFIFCKKFNYDLHIFLGSFSIFASRKGEKNIWFCFTPNRIMYDLKDWKFERDGFVKKIIYSIHIIFFQWLDQQVVKNNFKIIIAQTKHVQERIRKYYKKNSDVIYSPLNTKRYEFKKFGDYFLAVSRLSPEKRMDLIARAFLEMKDKKLIIVGNGAEKSKIKMIIKQCKNIILLDSVEDEELIRLYAECLATIYMPVNEDFGLVPIESMASGKACIAADEGGCRETIINNKTGFLIKATKVSIIKCVEKFDIQTANRMKEACIEHAKKFDLDVSIKDWIGVINTLNYDKSN